MRQQALDVLARSELARTEELELFDIAWKNVSGDDNGEVNGLGAATDEPAAETVDSDEHISENGTTDEVEIKEAGR